ncbi:MAG: hypothetical protein B6242_15365 [Anaerolineaceae bacterium 4572_78]|nr:MAG: hypothetical protein B6242_15365 [Anaerolineaceae bacterium 4572_78]
MAHKRIAIVGTMGVGKTTLARNLVERLNLNHVELDALYWQPNWIPMPAPLFREQVQNKICGSRWVIDGNYREVNDLVWQNADTVVWLDYSLELVMWQLSRRFLGNWLTQKELWNGNKESFYTHFCTKKSLFLKAKRTHIKYRQTYTEIMRKPEYAHITWLRFSKPADTKAWLNHLPMPRTHFVGLAQRMSFAI